MNDSSKLWILQADQPSPPEANRWDHVQVSRSHSFTYARIRAVVVAVADAVVIAQAGTALVVVS